jgi:hypothetical protein
MQCGREPGGSHADEQGVCPTSTATQHDGINGGTNGGRYCWAISGSFCNNGQQGHYAEKLGDCALCFFYRTVEREEERQFVVVRT